MVTRVIYYTAPGGTLYNTDYINGTFEAAEWPVYTTALQQPCLLCIPGPSFQVSSWGTESKLIEVLILDSDGPEHPFLILKNDLILILILIHQNQLKTAP